MQGAWWRPLCGWMCWFYGIACSSMARETSGGGLEKETNSFFSKSPFYPFTQIKKTRKPKIIQEAFVLFPLFCYNIVCLNLVCGTCPWRLCDSAFCCDSECYGEIKSCWQSHSVASLSAGLSEIVLSFLSCMKTWHEFILADISGDFIFNRLIHVTCHHKCKNPNYFLLYAEWGDWLSFY